MEKLTELIAKIYNEFKDLLDASGRLYAVAQITMEQMNKKGALRTTSKSYEKAAAILFAEAYSRFFSVKLLCEHGMGRSALIVERSMLNLFIILNWILNKQKKARGKRYIK
jgi:hypothetical protein